MASSKSACLRHFQRLTPSGPNLTRQLALFKTRHSSPAAIPSEQTRHFHASGRLNSPKDTSTIDFAFFPTNTLSSTESVAPALRVPLLPHNFFPPRDGAHAPLVADFDNVHKAEISTISASGTHINIPSAMSDVHDNNAMTVDFHEMAEKLEGVVKGVSEAVRDTKMEAPGVVKQIWAGMVDDVFGSKKGAAAA